MGNFNMMPENHLFQHIFDLYHLKNLVNEPTGFKSKTPTTIDQFATNAQSLFIHSSTLEIGVSDYQKMVYTFLKATSTKRKSKFVNYRFFRNFNQVCFEKKTL